MHTLKPGEVASTAAVGRGGRDNLVLPLTERLLAPLPGPRWIWVLGWGAIAALRPITDSLVLRQLGLPLQAEQLVGRALVPNFILGYIVVLALAGTSLLARGARECVAGLRSVREDGDPVDGRTIAGLDNSLGPILLAALLTALESLQVTTRHPPLVTLVDTLIVFVVAIPIATWVWVYAAVLGAADRLGRRTLSREPYPADRALGLRPLGTVAFNGFWVFAAAIVPFLLVVGRTPLDYAMGLALFLVVLAAFVLSLWRLHRRMVEVKQGHLATARALYAEAYAPLRQMPTLETLDQQRSLLSAAEALEKRAEGILEWPIDERLVTRVALIATGATATMVARLILSRFGL
ncbi:MAG: hypothetical protein M3301_03630 [Chloroflexota bacterium]|nr:hypothetical protein [Chloroflexota bacterium]